MVGGGEERKVGRLRDIRHLLKAARTNLDLETAFISQFVGPERVIRLVDQSGSDDNLREGERRPSASTFCRLVADGMLPELMTDAGVNPTAMALDVTREFGIGAHLSVPIRLSDGTIYGTFCCFAHTPRPLLDENDLTVLRAFADVTARYIEDGLFADMSTAEKEQRITAMIRSTGPDIVYQPVYMLDDLRVAGAEALSRFPAPPNRPVDQWFRDAADVGLSVELELVAIRNALSGFRAIWRRHRIQLGLNASAATITDERFWHAFEGYPRDLIVVELTEHEEVHDYTSLLAATTRLRQDGTRIAIDDVGAGYASMRHVLTVRPNILKLDIGLTRSIDSDDLRAALASSLKHFADRFDCRIVAEGVETREELVMLRELGMQAAQGYLLSRPLPAAALLAALEDALAHPGGLLLATAT